MGRPRLYQQKGAISEEKSKIINDIAKERIVEEITEHIAGRIGENERDLIQDIYVYLLDLPDPKLKGMQERGEMRWYITRMILNQYNSNTSDFYKKYRKAQLEHTKDDRHDDTDYYDYYDGGGRENGD